MENFQYRFHAPGARLTQSQPLYDVDGWDEQENGWKKDARGVSGLAAQPSSAESEYLAERRFDYRLIQEEQRWARSVFESQKIDRFLHGVKEEGRGLLAGGYQALVDTGEVLGSALAAGTAAVFGGLPRLFGFPDSDLERHQYDAGFAMLDSLALFTEDSTYSVIANQVAQDANEASRFGNYESGKARTTILLGVVSPGGWVKRLDTAATIARSAQRARRLSRNVLDGTNARVEFAPAFSPDLPPSPEKWGASALPEPKLSKDTNLALDPHQEALQSLQPIVDLMKQGEADIAKYKSALDQIIPDLNPKLFDRYAQPTPRAPNKYAPGTYNRQALYRHPEGNGDIVAIAWDAAPRLSISPVPSFHPVGRSLLQAPALTRSAGDWNYHGAPVSALAQSRLASLGRSPQRWNTRRGDPIGQSSHYHDHAGSGGLEVTLRGEGKEIRAELDAQGRPQAVGESPLLPGVVHVIEPEIIHKVLAVGEQLMVTLHIYVRSMNPARLRVFPTP